MHLLLVVRKQVDLLALACFLGVLVQGLKDERLALHAYLLNDVDVEGRCGQADDNENEVQVTELVNVVLDRDEKDERKAEHSDVCGSGEPIPVVDKLVAAAITSRKLVDDGHVRDLDCSPTKS